MYSMTCDQKAGLFKSANLVFNFEAWKINAGNSIQQQETFVGRPNLRSFL